MKLLSQKINLYVTQTSIHQGKKHKSLACNSANNHKTDQEGKILPRIQLFKTERIYLIGGFSCTHLGEAAISGHLWKHNVFSICMDYFKPNAGLLHQNFLKHRLKPIKITVLFLSLNDKNCKMYLAELQAIDFLSHS